MTTPTANARSLWVIVPAYNEAGSISKVVGNLVVAYPQVIVVDDGSSDATAENALGAGAVVLRHPINLGQGAALQTGIMFALQHNADLIVTFDADGQHDVGDIGSMICAMIANGADVALGSRFLGSAPGIEWHRRVILRLAVWFTLLTTRLRLTDAHNGLRVFSRLAAEKIRITQNRMAHASEILECIARLKLRYVEVPVTISYSEYSKAKGQKARGALTILSDLLIGRFYR